MIVYLITNKLNNKKYVGQTIRPIKERFDDHCHASRAKHMPIAAAIQKYGRDNFAIEILCECSSKEELDKMELCFANKFDTFAPNGYNLKAGSGRGAMSLETRKKISVALKGRKTNNRNPYIALAAKLAKEYDLISPSGLEIHVYNMREHCRKYNLLSSSMSAVVNGKEGHHKGWKVKK